jgi:hypothetical protein
MMEQVKKKKKLTLNTVGLLLLVVMAVAYFYLWQAKTDALARVATLTDNVTVTRLIESNLAAPAVGLEAKLEDVKAEFAAVGTGFPTTVDRNEVIDYILNMADEYKIEILPLVSDGWSKLNSGMEYRVLSITATAQGSLKDVESFMTALQAGRYPTLVITGFSVARINTAAPGFPGDEMPVTVNMNIGIYTVQLKEAEGALK